MEKASSDVIAAASGWFLAAQGRDVAYILRESHAPDPAAIHSFASGPGNLTLDGLVEHLRGYPPIEAHDIDFAGWVHDDFSWLTGTSRVALPTDEDLMMRMTVVMLRVDGDWKITHFHLSEGVDHDV